MSNNLKKKNARNASIPSLRDENGFMILQRTQKDPDGFMVLKRKNATQPVAEVEAEIPANNTTVEGLISEYENKIKNSGKFITPNEEQSRIIEVFVNRYVDSRNPSVDDTKSAGHLIRIAKTFYEYSENVTFMSDFTYDALISKYLHGGNTEPTGFVPKGSKSFSKVEIKYPALHNNMDKCYRATDSDPVPEGVKETASIKEFLINAYKAISMSPSDKITIEISPKIDGVSINGTVHEGRLIKPQTRGDESESIYVAGLDGMVIGNPDIDVEDFGIQYEAFVTEKNRVKASEYLGMAKPYVSCRSAAAGIIHRLFTEKDEELVKFLNFYPINSDGLPGTYDERIDFLNEYGKVPSDMIKRTIVTGSLEELVSRIRYHFSNIRIIRTRLSFAIDGIVITIIDSDYQKKIGRDGRTNKFQIAYKFDPANAEAIIKSIGIDSGRKGFRTIRVNLEKPVYLDGVRYDHVPILSYEIYKSLGLSKGNEINIHRVGDVIPAISRTNSILNMDSYCCDTFYCTCGRKLRVYHKKLYCNNPDCADNIIGQFADFFEKIGMVGYSDSFAKDLYKQANCRDLSDLVNLTEEKLTSCGLTSKAALNFPKALHDAMSEVNDIQMLAAMGLPGVDEAKAMIILKMKSFEELKDLDDNKAMAIATAAVGELQAPNLAEIMTSSRFRRNIIAIAPCISGEVTKDFSESIFHKIE